MSTLADRFVATGIRRTECLQSKQLRYGNAAKFRAKETEEVKIRSYLLFTSVVDRGGDADPDPDFHSNADPDFHSDADPDPDFHSDADPDLDWLKNEDDPHEDPTQCFTHVRKSDSF